MSLIVEFLQDPDYKDDIDWTGSNGTPHGVYNTIGSGDWQREVQVGSLMYVYIRLFPYIIGYILISPSLGTVCSSVLSFGDPIQLTLRSRDRRRHITSLCPPGS